MKREGEPQGHKKGKVKRLWATLSRSEIGEGRDGLDYAELWPTKKLAKENSFGAPVVEVEVRAV